MVNVEHGNEPMSSSDVLVNYINDNKSYQVHARGRRDGLLQHDHSAYRVGFAGGAVSGIETSRQEPIAIHHRRSEKLESNEGAGNWCGHVAWKYASGSADGFSSEHRAAMNTPVLPTTHASFR